MVTEFVWEKATIYFSEQLSSTSFPGFLFFSSPGTRDGRKREPGNKVELS